VAFAGPTLWKSDGLKRLAPSVELGRLDLGQAHPRIIGLSLASPLTDQPGHQPSRTVVVIYQ